MCRRARFSLPLPLSSPLQPLLVIVLPLLPLVFPLLLPLAALPLEEPPVANRLRGATARTRGDIVLTPFVGSRLGGALGGGSPSQESSVRMALLLLRTLVYNFLLIIGARRLSNRPSIKTQSTRS